MKCQYRWVNGQCQSILGGYNGNCNHMSLWSLKGEVNKILKLRLIQEKSGIQTEN